MNLELFPCSGGLAWGLRAAGIRFDLSIDKSPDACASYERNHGHRPICMDVNDFYRMVMAGWRPHGPRSWDVNGTLHQRPLEGTIELFVADPPCTGEVVGRAIVEQMAAARAAIDLPPASPSPSPAHESRPIPDGVSLAIDPVPGTHFGEGGAGDLLAAAETAGQDTPDETGTTLAVGWAARETDGASGGHGTTGPGATTPDDKGTPAAANSSSKATKPKPRIKILLVDETGAEREATP